MAADKTQFALRAGFDLGGDHLYHVVYTDGTTADIYAGNGLYFSAGATIPITDNFEFEPSLGYKFDMINGSNGSITWNYFPLDLLAVYNFKKVAFGAGVTYHLNPSLTGDGIASGVNFNFENALGTLFEVDYRIGDNMLLGLRANIIEYKYNTTTVSGNSTGLTFRIAM